MNKTEIKKALYKEKPIAKQIGFSLVDDKNAFHYITILSNKEVVSFHVPVEEGKEFDNILPAQLLIRWIE